MQTWKGFYHTSFIKILAPNKAYQDTHWQLQFSLCPEARSHPSRESFSASCFVWKVMNKICYALQFLDVCIFYNKIMHRCRVLPSSGPGESDITVDRQILWTPRGRVLNKIILSFERTFKSNFTWIWPDWSPELFITKESLRRSSICLVSL